jgi:hypothetical protein
MERNLTVRTDQEEARTKYHCKGRGMVQSSSKNENLTHLLAEFYRKGELFCGKSLGETTALILTLRIVFFEKFHFELTSSQEEATNFVRTQIIGSITVSVLT